MADDTVGYEIKFSEDFDKALQRFVKKKRFTRLPGQIRTLIDELKEGRFSGTLLTREDKPIHYVVYKKRLPNPDANKGESGGYRAIYLAEHDNRYIAFLTIYYKAEQETVTDAYIGGLVDGILMDHSE